MLWCGKRCQKQRNMQKRSVRQQRALHGAETPSSILIVRNTCVHRVTDLHFVTMFTESHMSVHTGSAVYLKNNAVSVCLWLCGSLYKNCKVTQIISVASNRCRAFLGLAFSLSPRLFLLLSLCFLCLSPLKFHFRHILVLQYCWFLFLSTPLPLFLSATLPPVESVSVSQIAATVKHQQQA